MFKQDFNGVEHPILPNVKICGLKKLPPLDEDIDFSYIEITISDEFQLFFSVREQTGCFPNGQCKR